MTKYTKEQKSKTLKRVRDRRAEAHNKARKLLEELGFAIDKDMGPISTKPWDFIAKKHGLTFYVDAKSPFAEKGKFIISLNELRGMLKLRIDGIPAYLFVLPEGKTMLFTAT